MPEAPPSCVFAGNLDELIRLQGLNRKATAEGAGVPYKWLRRAVTQGISVRSIKNSHHIENLVAFFGLTKADDLWRDDLIQLQVGEDVPLAASPFEAARRQLCVKKLKALLSSQYSNDAHRLVDRLFDKSGMTLTEPSSNELEIPSTWKTIIKWAGSKKRQASQIVSRFPKKIATYHEPFLGGGSVMLELLTSDIDVEKFQCSDSYSPLINLWNLVKYEPQRVSRDYDLFWNKLSSQGADYYYDVRASFNANHNPCELFFLLQTTRNGFFRFNRKGEFMGNFRKGDFGTQGLPPHRIHHMLGIWSEKLITKDVRFQVSDYRDVLPNPGDLLYLDPPYPNVTRPIYHSEIDFDQFLSWLGRQRCTYFLSLDGFSGSEDRTIPVPGHLFDEHLQIENPNPFHPINGKPGLLVTDSLYIRKSNSRRKPSGV